MQITALSESTHHLLFFEKNIEVKTNTKVIYIYSTTYVYGR